MIVLLFENYHTLITKHNCFARYLFLCTSKPYMHAPLVRMKMANKVYNKQSTVLPSIIGEYLQLLRISHGKVCAR